MMFKKHKDKLNETIPWYVNGTMGETERHAIQYLLVDDPTAKDELAFWERLDIAVKSQAEISPPDNVRRSLMERIYTTSAVPSQAQAWLAWAAGAFLAIVALILLWVTIRPGTALEWSVAGPTPSAFRIYRASDAGGEYTMISEIPVQDGKAVYQYIDAQLLPGKTYFYRVEGLGDSGPVAFSQSVSSNAAAALPAQLAIMFSSIIVGVIAAFFVRDMMPRILPLQGAILA